MAARVSKQLVEARINQSQYREFCAQIYPPIRVQPAGRGSQSEDSHPSPDIKEVHSLMHYFSTTFYKIYKGPVICKHMSSQKPQVYLVPELGYPCHHCRP